MGKQDTQRPFFSLRQDRLNCITSGFALEDLQQHEFDGILRQPWYPRQKESLLLESFFLTADMSVYNLSSFLFTMDKNRLFPSSLQKAFYVLEGSCHASLQAAFFRLNKLSAFSLSSWLRFSYRYDDSQLLLPGFSPIRAYASGGLVWRNGQRIPGEALQADLKDCQRSLLAMPLFLYPKLINRMTIELHSLNHFQLVNWETGTVLVE